MNLNADPVGFKEAEAQKASESHASLGRRGQASGLAVCDLRTALRMSPVGLNHR